MRQNLEEMAVDRLMETADDDERWSFLFRTNGSKSFLYYPWHLAQDRDFDGDLENLDLPWTEERRAAIARGDADPNNEEMNQWRQAKCRYLAAGSDWCCIAWIVPLWIEEKAAGYALFVFGQNAVPDVPPRLVAVFESFLETRSALDEEGAVAD